MRTPDECYATDAIANGAPSRTMPMATFRSSGSGGGVRHPSLSSSPSSTRQTRRSGKTAHATVAITWLSSTSVKVIETAGFSAKGQPIDADAGLPQLVLCASQRRRRRDCRSSI